MQVFKYIGSLYPPSYDPDQDYYLIIIANGETYLVWKFCCNDTQWEWMNEKILPLDNSTLDQLWIVADEILDHDKFSAMTLEFEQPMV